MSSAGRAVNSSGCVTKPKGRGIGLSGSAAQIRPSWLTGSYVMETAEHREPCESRGSRTVLGAPGGEIPPGDSTAAKAEQVQLQANEVGGGERQRIAPLLAGDDDRAAKPHHAGKPS